MAITDYSATDTLNKTVPGSPAIEIGKGIHSPQGHDIQRQAIQRIMADLKTFSGTVLTSAIAGAAGLAILADEEADDVRVTINALTYASGLATLKALDTTKDTYAYFDGSVWDWKTGDYSTQVAADTGGAIFAKADAIATTSGAWVRRYEMVEDKWFGTAADGVTDDTAALARVAAVLAVIGGALLGLTPGGNYLADDWDCSTVLNTKIFSRGAEFTERTGTEGDTGATGRALFISFGAASGIDHLEYTLPTGLTRRRVTDLSETGSYIGTWNITSVDQQNNRADRTDGAGGSETGDGENTDAAIIFSGSNVVAGSGDVANFDHPYRVSSTDHELGQLRSTSFVNGCWFNEPTRGYTQLVLCRTASPNAGVIAGHNGALISGCTKGVIGFIDSEDAGEHGIRFGTASDGLFLLGYRVHNAGASGVKFRSDSAADRNRNGYIGPGDISDCGTGSVAGDWGANEEGILMERCSNMVMVRPRIFKVDKAKSCARGILVNSSSKIQIINALIEDVDDQAIFLENTDGSENVDLIDITIKADITGPASHFSYMVFSLINIEGIHLDINGRDAAGDGYHLANAGTGVVLGSCTFRGSMSTVTGTDVAGTGTTNAYTGREYINFDYSLNGQQKNYRLTSTATDVLESWGSRNSSAGKDGIKLFADGKFDTTGPLEFRPGASVTPTANGDVVLELTNNTTLTIRAKGSDGTVRSGTVTLA